MSEPVPTSMISANFSGVFGLLYTDSKGFVRWLRGPSPDSTKDSSYTTQNAIQLKGTEVIKALPGKVTITGWSHSEGVRELRLFYIEMSDKPIPQLKEICMTIKKGGKVADTTWYEGKDGIDTFNAEQYFVDPNSPLTATNNNGSLRVYFKKAGAKELTCAYTIQNPEKVVVPPPTKERLRFWKDFVVTKEGNF